MRQNIDEKWKSDPRRKALVKRLGSERLADGMRVEINWLLLDHKGKPIPMKEFKFVENFQDWIDCELGEIVGDAVRVVGADRYEEFYEKQTKNGSKGGRPRKKPKETQNNPENPSSSSSSSEIDNYKSYDLRNWEQEARRLLDALKRYGTGTKDRKLMQNSLGSLFWIACRAPGGIGAMRAMQTNDFTVRNIASRLADSAERFGFDPPGGERTA